MSSTSKHLPAPPLTANHLSPANLRLRQQQTRPIISSALQRAELKTNVDAGFKDQLQPDTMLRPSVNKTSLHPGGVEPKEEHTELEEELLETAHIDYNRVSIIANPSVPALYEDALVYESGTAITSSGALTAYSGKKTGRSPLDKRIVKEPGSENDVWWGPVNKAMSEEVWKINRERAVDYLNTRSRIYVVDGYAGWDERYRIKVRVVCSRAYHALFMRNMLIRPSRKELEHFHPDYTIYNAGSFPANRYTSGMTSPTSVAINFAAKEMVILGTEYAGEMKKGVFTVLFYEMPVKHNVLTLHSSANEGKDGDVTVFFGLSGTGKTTLSADLNRALIGDDEHCWSEHGVFNIEGGCYAKTINLSAEKEPDIYNAIKYGSILENVVFDDQTREVDYDDITLTENTRCAYPIEYIPNAKIPCMSDSHPTNIILLTCDARGVLPPISKLTPAQVMFHFISGYTSKMAGTEVGVTEPQATFSSCFAQPFLALHPMRYARMLADKIQHHRANAWLLNTGWVGSSAAKGGKRCPLKYTRAILDAIHSGELARAEYSVYDTFNLPIPRKVSGVPDELLNPASSWMAGPEDFREEVTKLAKLFNENFEKYADQATEDVIAAGPKIKSTESKVPVNGEHKGVNGVNGVHEESKSMTDAAPAQQEAAPASAAAPVTNGIHNDEPVAVNGDNKAQTNGTHPKADAITAPATTTTGEYVPVTNGSAKHELNAVPEVEPQASFATGEMESVPPTARDPIGVGSLENGLAEQEASQGSTVRATKTAAPNPVDRVRQNLLTRSPSNQGPTH